MPHKQSCITLINFSVKLVKQEIQVIQSRFDRSDEQATELKLQVVELQLEKVTCEQNLQESVTTLQVMGCNSLTHPLTHSPTYIQSTTVLCDIYEHIIVTYRPIKNVKKERKKIAEHKLYLEMHKLKVYLLQKTKTNDRVHSPDAQPMYCNKYSVSYCTHLFVLFLYHAECSNASLCT